MPSSNPLADRVRRLIGARRFTEKPMFGGICFLVNGNMALGASKRGLMVRIARQDTAKALQQPGTRPMVMRGRQMEGYLYVEGQGTERDTDLAGWIDAAFAYVATLPAKAAGEKPQRPARRG